MPTGRAVLGRGEEAAEFRAGSGLSGAAVQAAAGSVPFEGLPASRFAAIWTAASHRSIGDRGVLPAGIL